MAANRLYVGNLSFHTTEAALRSAVAAFGNVETVDMPVDRETGRLRGFAFVTMDTPTAMQEAIKGLNEKDFMGRPLAINEARPKEDRPAYGGGGGGGGRGGYGGGGGGGGRY